MIYAKIMISFLTHRKKIILVVARDVNCYLPELFIKKWRHSFFFTFKDIHVLYKNNR